MLKKYKTVFMGTPDFSLPSLEILNNHPLIDLKKIITMPDRKAGRGQNLKTPPIAQFAKENKLPLLQTSNINKELIFLKEMKKEKVDLFIVIAFAQFLNNDLLALPQIGCFNIHTSLLPKYRGAAPIQYALMNGDSETGVTIQKMVKKMDAGDIVLQDKIYLSNSETGGQLYTKLKFQAALSLDKFITMIEKNSLKYTVQDESKVTTAPTLKKENGFLNFETMSALTIFNKIRALVPWPATYFYMNNKRVKVLTASLEEGTLNAGTLSIKNDTLVIGCCDKKTIRLKTIQQEGKKVCSDIQFLLGHKNKCELLSITKKES